MPNNHLPWYPIDEKIELVGPGLPNRAQKTEVIRAHKLPTNARYDPGLRIDLDPTSSRSIGRSSKVGV
jgi:hypothetical protein